MVVNVIAVKFAVDGVFTPMFTLSTVPVTAGLIITVPDPDGLIVTLPPAGVKFTAPVAVNVVNVPAAGVVAPIMILSKFPVVVGASVNVPDTVKFVTEKLVLLRLNVKVFVSGLVVTTNAPVPVTFSVLFVGVKLIGFCPGTAIYVYPFIKLLPLVVVLVYYLTILVVC